MATRNPPRVSVAAMAEVVLQERPPAPVEWKRLKDMVTPEARLSFNAVELYQLAEQWESEALARESIWLQDPVAAALKHCAQRLRSLVAKQKDTQGTYPKTDA